MFDNKVTFECNNMKKRRIISKSMTYFIVTFFSISISLLPVIADQGGNNGNGDLNFPNSPPTNPNNDNYGNGNSYEEQYGGENGENKGLGQNREQNQYGEQNQKRKQNRTGVNDNVSGKRMRYQHRNMEMTFEGNCTMINSEWEQDEFEDEFEITFEIDKVPRLIFNYKNNKHTSQNELNFQVQIKELIEYKDENYNGRYDEDDIIVNAYSFENSNFKNFTYRNQSSDEGNEINQISTQTEDGIFKMNLLFSGDFSQIGNQILTPSEVKIDFIINNYPFKEDSTQLALRTMLETEHETELNYESFDEMQGFSENESVFDITTLNIGGFFSWAENVIVDNISRPVNYTIQSKIIETIIDNEKISNKVSNIYFSYPRGSNIVHDPKLGVVSISFEAFTLQSIGTLINMDNVFLYIGICMLASILFLGVIIIRKRI